MYFIILSLCFISGIGLFLFTGLPQRADYSGFIIDEAQYAAPEIGHIAPPFSLSDLDFKTVGLANSNDHIVIINFWATWCVPCRIEMPELQNLYDEYADDVIILGVNLGESPQAVAQWVEEFDLTFDVLLDPLQSVAQLYQIRGQPSTYIIDKAGMIRQVYYGPVSMQKLEQNINALQNSQ